MITICASNGLYRNRNDIPAARSSKHVSSMGAAVNSAVGIAKIVRPGRDGEIWPGKSYWLNTKIVLKQFSSIWRRLGNRALNGG
jgi:hypothetical protein